jgi:stage V sporulation protein AA
MPAASVPKLYIRFRKRTTQLRGRPIRLGHVAQVLTIPPLQSELERLILFEPAKPDGSHVLIDALTVMKKVRSRYPDFDLEVFGEPHALVEIVDGDRKPKWWLVVPVWVLLFIGSGLAIMNFHADVSMPEVHRRIYELITGKQVEHPYWLQIPYSIGVGLGMVLFFNHLFRKQLNDEPSPLEVEMYLYQENMNQFVILEEYGKMHKGQKGESIDDTSRS